MGGTTAVEDDHLGSSGVNWLSATEEARISVGGVGEAGKTARAVLFRARDDLAYVTRVAIEVDGGNAACWELLQPAKLLVLTPEPCWCRKKFEPRRAYGSRSPPLSDTLS